MRWLTLVRSSRRGRAGVRVRRQIYLVIITTTTITTTTPLRGDASTASAESAGTPPRQARALRALARRKTPAQIAELAVTLAHRRTRSGADEERAGHDETAQRQKRSVEMRTFLGFNFSDSGPLLGAVVRRRSGQGPLYWKRANRRRLLRILFLLSIFPCIISTESLSDQRGRRCDIYSRAASTFGSNRLAKPFEGSNFPGSADATF